MQFTAEYWITTLQLSAHVEGGAYKRTYCSPINIPLNELPETFHGDRPTSTAIYFLLQQDEYSAMHRIASDELWHFYYGNPLTIYEIEPSGVLTTHLLGNNPVAGETFQCCVKAGSWFGSSVKSGGNYALVGCTVSPGFDFEDFELGDRQALITQFPQHEAVITALTK